MNTIRNFLKWGIYSILFMILLLPFFGVTLKTTCGGLILGFFSSLINSLRGNLKDKTESGNKIS